MTIAENLHAVKKRIAAYETKYHRDAGSVRLLAASKGQGIAKIKEAIAAGQQVFGENYLQEALAKMTTLSDASLEWHFIGKIQSNKTRKIAEHFDWVQSVDDSSIAKRLNDYRPSHLAPLNVCIEVNISHQATKSGIAIENIEPLIEVILTLPRLRLRGLMASPAEHQQNQFISPREAFHQLFAKWQSLKLTYPMLDTLSMGMTEDMEEAIAEGATIVRIGTAIFGVR